MSIIIVSPFGVNSDSIPGGTNHIRGALQLAPLADSHKLRIIDYLDKVNEEELSQRVRSRPAFVVPMTELAALKNVKGRTNKADMLLQIHRFALEHFAGFETPMVAFEFEGEQVKSHALDRADFFFRQQNPQPLPDHCWRQHLAYLKFLYDAFDRSPLAQLALTRLSRAFRTSCTPDGVIDLAVALECLVIAQNEVKFQFSLNHALIHTSDPGERHALFAKLQNLYDVRSKIVHGADLSTKEQRKFDAVAADWIELIAMARRNITYYLLFCSQRNAADWQEHLRALALGEARIELGA